MPFRKGQSGNPGGRKKRGPEEIDVKALAKQHTSTAIATLVDCLAHDDGRVRVAAAEALLSRGFGRPAPQRDDLDVEQVRAAIDLTNAKMRAIEAGQGIDGSPAPTINVVLPDWPAPSSNGNGHNGNGEH